MTDDLKFFENLRAMTKAAFAHSPIYQKQIDKKEHWSYSICSTPIQRGKGILLGINWGGSGEYEVQNKMPDGNDILNYNFIKRSKHFFDEYLPLKFDEPNFNYTNLCFFRTPDISLLSFLDYKLSYPLFEEYVKYIKPPWIFSLGTTNYNVLKDLGKMSPLEVKTYHSESKYYGVAGKFLGCNFYAVPHPNVPLKTRSRNEIWAQVGKQFMNDMII